ncbi:bestrophin family protein [Xanthocytophaga flava]|uniref:bestrophin family protein n=1 Tax=Xanthocytophaga flava TaxID=3048013 RepID=UPI0028D82012|nr:bestrophin family ion channel [Xanthocytophaga flavus]MDJ1473520.1 bestrophin family ion channel [Xanthocytophaga flavus]
MISYNPKEWFTFIFRFHKSDTLRQLAPLMAALGIYSWAVAYVELEYWKLSENNHLRNLTVVHSLLGFVISMLLVFRTNTAYDRWWEGRRLWGSLVNNSRNLAIKLAAILPPEDASNRHFFKRVIALYASTLAAHLQSEATRLALDEQEHPDLKDLDKSKHLPNQVATLLFGRTNKLYEENKIKEAQLIVLNGELLSFTDVCGACERIKNTPIPFSYSIFIKKFIFFYVMTMPFGFVFSLGYWVIPVVIFVFYVLASIELIAEEIEDPFGGDANDLPTFKIASNIKKHIGEIL